MQLKYTEEIIYHHAKYFRKYFSFMSFFGSRMKCARWLVLQHYPPFVKQEKMQDGGGREIGSSLKFQWAGRFGCKTEQSVSFRKARNVCCVIPGREEGREGIEERVFVQKRSRDLKASASQNQQVSAAGQATTEILMLINNIWRPMQMYYGRLCAMRYKSCT